MALEPEEISEAEAQWEVGVTDAERVCEHLCAMFEDPANWDFDSTVMIKKWRTLYREARKALGRASE